jgi:hypothetical protein
VENAIFVFINLIFYSAGTFMKSYKYGEDFIIEASFSLASSITGLPLSTGRKVRPYSNSSSISVLPRGRKYCSITQKIKMRLPVLLRKENCAFP